MTTPEKQAALIAELRDNRNDFPSYLHSLCRVAADEIERLSASLRLHENERARAEDAEARAERAEACLKHYERVVSVGGHMHAAELLARLGYSQDEKHR